MRMYGTKKMNLFIFVLHLNKISCCKIILNIDILFRFYFEFHSL